MKAISLRKGLYQVLKTYLETHNNGKQYPIAEVLFKGEKSKFYEKQITKVRLRSLYNVKSEGPKHIPYSGFNKYILDIQDLVIIPHNKDPHKPQHCVIWNLIEVQNYTEMFNELSAIDHDFHLQEMEILELHNCIIADEFLQDEFEANITKISQVDDQHFDKIVSNEVDPPSEDPNL